MTQKIETISIYMDGHEGHRGHVLAHAWIAKLEALIMAYSSMERDFVGAPRRQTEYEVVEARKVNPTIIEIRPTAKRVGYDPMPAFLWANEQLERISQSGEADSTLSASSAKLIAEMAKPPTADSYRRFWINGQTAPVEFNEEFATKAANLAADRRAKESPLQWFEGVSIGSVVGSLRLVDDLSGEQHFAIRPAVGPSRIDCFYEPELEDKLSECLFRNVRVQGRLTYRSDSPHPVSVQVTSIEELQPAAEGLSSLKGLLRDFELPSGGLEQFLRE